MTKFEYDGGETPPDTPIDRLFSDLYDDGSDDEALPYDSVLFSLHNYFEEGLALTHSQASTLIRGMIQNNTIPPAAMFEADRLEAFARLKVGLHAELMPLCSALYTPDDFESWLPGMMDVILSGHNEDNDDCMEVLNYDATHCPEGFCPVRAVCGKIIRDLRKPELASLEYRHLPYETARANLAQLNYLVAEEYLLPSVALAIYHDYKNLVEEALPGFQLDNSDGKP